MLHRLAAMLIVGFWLAMTGLLVLREVYPESTRLNTIPMSYVGSLFFQHHQSSDLQIYDAGREVGYVHLQPKSSNDQKTRTIEMQGNLTISPLGVPRQRLSWFGGLPQGGALLLDENNDIQAIHLVITIQEPASQLELRIDRKTNTAQFVVNANGNIVDSSTITMDRQGLAKLLQRTGFDTSILQQLQASSAETPPAEITAYQSSTRLNGETVSTYLVSMKVSGQTIFDAHVSQLGQILRAQVPLLGYKLSPYNVAP